MTQDQDIRSLWPIGALIQIEFDSFTGTVIGHYTRNDGKQGIVAQYLESTHITNIVHVYGAKHIKPWDGSTHTGSTWQPIPRAEPETNPELLKKPLDNPSQA